METQAYLKFWDISAVVSVNRKVLEDEIHLTKASAERWGKKLGVTPEKSQVNVKAIYVQFTHVLNLKGKVKVGGRVTIKEMPCPLDGCNAKFSTKRGVKGTVIFLGSEDQCHKFMWETPPLVDFWLTSHYM